MSGGVDSSVAAAILKRKGYEVCGLHFSLTGKQEDLTDVLSVCEKLNIELTVRDFSRVFNEKVLSAFVADYSSGKTPNICVGCNRHVKFGETFAVMEELGCDYVATGHYCSIEEVNGAFYLKKGADALKDQSYFLNQLTEEKLKKIIFPLAGLQKSDVRKIAEEEGLITAHKKGSADVCLAGDRSFRDFLRDYIPPNEGKIVDEKGSEIGRHDGIPFYTLGQRKGLGIGGRAGDDGGRWFVVKKNASANELIVSHGDEARLFSQVAFVDSFNFINGVPEKKEFRCLGKTRYREKASPATAYVTDGGVKVVFDEAKRAVTEGQYLVLYDGDFVLGGGEISGAKSLKP